MNKKLIHKHYVIEGDPIPLARARMGKQRMWDSQKQKKLYCGIELKRQHGNEPLFEGPLSLDVCFYMPIPKSKSAIQREKLIDTYHTFIPDSDNLIKWICDIASGGVLYDDDCIIAAISAQKVYAEHPRTEFVITTLTNEKHINRRQIGDSCE